MASGRKFWWQTPDGRVLKLDRDLGYWVLRGVTGLGKPIYTNDLEARSNADGVIVRGSRAATRQVFLPMEISGSSRTELLSRTQTLGEMTNPKNGAGYLYITDGGKTYRLKALYREGMEGDEGASAAGENDGHWQRTGPVFEAVDPFFEDPSVRIEDWGYSGALPFFPLPPVRLNPEQVLSDIGQPVRNNFVLNPSAETNALNWTNSALGSTPSQITRSAAMAMRGNWCFRIEAAAAGGTGILAFPDQASANNPFTPGDTYTFHGWVYIPTGQPNVRAEIFFVNSGADVLQRDQWVWVKNTWIASATGDRPIFNQTNSGGGATVPLGAYYYVDAVCVSEGIITSPDEYIDGDQLYCHWLGTPHASQSYSDPIYEPSVVNVEGTVETYPVWRIVGPGSIITLENARTGRLLRLNLPTPMVSGDVITIDTQNKTIYQLIGGVEVSLYQYLEEDDFWPLLPGSNAVRLAMTEASTGSQIVLTYNNRYESIVA